MSKSSEANPDAHIEREVLFDRSEEYEAMLNQGLQLSGEAKDYFELGRIAALRRAVDEVGIHGSKDRFSPRSILDFGCGTGSTSRLLAESFPDANVVGVDMSQPLIERARRDLASQIGNEAAADRVRFELIDNLTGQKFDLCYVNGVFHHIPPDQRPKALEIIHHSLAAGGYFSFFENNPWNPGTRLVMRRIPFDRDAITISPRQARSMLEHAGFTISRSCESLFYFPRVLRFLRPAEPLLGTLPLGAQYWLFCQKPG